jgi:predicted membrane-bound mannosyltransferase
VTAPNAVPWWHVAAALALILLAELGLPRLIRWSRLRADRRERKRRISRGAMAEGLHLRHAATSRGHLL